MYFPNTFDSHYTAWGGINRKNLAKSVIIKKIPPAAALIRLRICCANAVSLKKQVISRILLTLNYFKGLPIIYLGQWLPKSSNRLPFSSGVQPFPDNYRDTDLHGVAPYRVYLVSLQPYLYILSVALVLISRWTGVTRYTALWCPDFPLPTLGGER